MTVHDEMVAFFVNLFKMPLRQLNGKQVSQNVDQIAKNVFSIIQQMWNYHLKQI